MDKIKPKIIEVDDILRGYSNSDKLPEIYFRIRSEVLISKPIQISPIGLGVVEGSFRRGSYEFEIYNIEEGNIIIETWGAWKGYVNSGPQPRIREGSKQDDRDSGWSNLKITLHGETSKQSKDIEGIIADFPEKAQKERVIIQQNLNLFLLSRS